MAEQLSGNGRRNEAREQGWRQVFAEQAKSGWSVARFCRERGIATSSFYFWRSELARREAERRAAGQTTTKAASPTAGFVEVGMALSHSDEERRERKAAPVVIQLGSTRVEVPSGFDRDTLAQVLAVLHEQDAQRGAAC